MMTVWMDWSFTSEIPFHRENLIFSYILEESLCQRSNSSCANSSISLPFLKNTRSIEKTLSRSTKCSSRICLVRNAHSSCCGSWKGSWEDRVTLTTLWVFRFSRIEIFLEFFQRDLIANMQQTPKEDALKEMERIRQHLWLSLSLDIERVRIHAGSHETDLNDSRSARKQSPTSSGIAPDASTMKKRIHLIRRVRSSKNKWTCVLKLCNWRITWDFCCKRKPIKEKSVTIIMRGRRRTSGFLKMTTRTLIPNRSRWVFPFWFSYQKSNSLRERHIEIKPFRFFSPQFLCNADTLECNYSLIS